MAAYTTVQDLIDDLNTRLGGDSRYQSHEVKQSQSVSDPDGWGYDLQMIEYRVIRTNDMLESFKFWVVVNEDETVNWWRGSRNGVSGGIPNPFKDSDTIRDPYRTDQQYSDAIESQFPEWTVLEIETIVESDLDRVEVRAANNSDDRVIDRTIIVWKDDIDNLQWKLKE